MKPEIVIRSCSMLFGRCRSCWMHPFNENLPPVLLCHDCENVLAFALVLFLHFLIPTAPALPLACGSVMSWP